LAIINVSNAAQLTSALATARGGDTIRLAAGDYDNVSIQNFRPTSRVTLVSADVANPAHFDTLAVRTSQNLTFKNLDIGRALAPGEPEHTQLTLVRDSSTIVFEGNLIHGSLDGDAQNDGYGLFVDGVTGLAITNNTFKELGRGAVVSTITNLQVSGNKFLDIRSDALDTDDSSNVLIEDNLFKGFYPLDYDHPDAMQFHNLGATEWMENITIRNNILLPGGTGSPQGIWISDPGTTGFRNLHIENNLLWGKGLYNGIGLYGVENAKVIGNTVLSPTDDDKMMWIRVSGSDNVELIRNVAEEFIIQGGITNLRQEGNINLRTSPAFRGLMANPENPSGWNDVRLSDGGAYTPVVTSSEAPVSSAAGNALKNLLSPTTGQSVAQLVSVLTVDDAAEELDLSRAAELAGAPAAPVAVSVPFEPVTEFSGFVSHHWRDGHQDWFVALP
jgi:hypothetical protein